MRSRLPFRDLDRSSRGVTAWDLGMAELVHHDAKRMRSRGEQHR